MTKSILATTGGGARFPFGRNWQRFLSVVDDQRIDAAERSLAAMLGVDDLSGKSFVDAGSGSGLSSLAARRLGARVVSFDYDAEAVACTVELKRRYRPGDEEWTIQQGSVLDTGFLASLGRHDVVYSWGVLHHTGDLWQALGNITVLVGADGVLFVSIYNDQRWISRLWTAVKRLYNTTPRPLKFLLEVPAFVVVWGPNFLKNTLLGHPLKDWKSSYLDRGMSPWYDLVDWVGGYPFEVARPDDVFRFYRDRGFSLVDMKTCGGGKGCNEFVFKRERHASGMTTDPGL